MDQVAELTTIVQHEVENYVAGSWLKARGYAVSDTNRHIYTVVAIPDYPRKYPAGIVIIARIVNNQVVIEHDITDRPLVHELVRAGIPREQIILTYVGEKLPESMQP